MITPSLPKNVQFTIETMFASKNGRVGRIVPDERGFYCHLPMLVLGIPTENNTFYDVDSITSKMNDPNGGFYKKLHNQQLFGEWGHPNFLEYPEDKQLARLLTVREERHSHLFQAIRVGKTLENGGVVVEADILPVKPFGDALRESLDSPYINTGFSLRAWINTEMRGNLKYRTVNKMTTVDAVGAGGYPDASKKNALGLESFDEFDFNVVRDGKLVCREAALECLSDTELNDIFGTSNIRRFTQTFTVAKLDPVILDKFPTQYPRSVFHDYFKGGKG